MERWKGRVAARAARMTMLAGVLTLPGAAPLALAAAPASAQEPAECRCVDADGNEIEDCTCFRMPRITEVMPRMAMYGDRGPRLGISVDVTEGEADAGGALVSAVLEGGPADEAGIREGDLITHIDGRSLTEPIGGDAERDFDLDASIPAQRLLALARELEPGESVEVVYLREGQRQTTVVEAEDLSDRWATSFGFRAPRWEAEQLRDRLEGLSDRARAWRFRAEPRGDMLVHPEGGPLRMWGPEGTLVLGGGGLASGLDLVELNPALGEYFGAEEGVLVLDVRSSSTLGLEPGDVVLAVDGREVATPGRLRRILTSYADDEDVELRIVRDGREMTITGPMRRP